VDLDEETALMLILEKRGNITEAAEIARTQIQEIREKNLARLLAGMRRTLAAIQASSSFGCLVGGFLGARTLDAPYATRWLNLAGNDVGAALEAFGGSVKEWCCMTKSNIRIKETFFGTLCVCVPLVLLHSQSAVSVCACVRVVCMHARVRCVRAGTRSSCLCEIEMTVFGFYSHAHMLHLTHMLRPNKRSFCACCHA
jgi:hypothetical protein